MLSRSIAFSLVAAAVLASAQVGHATLVQATFNDNTAGVLDGQSGGSGFATSWAASPVNAINVVAGNLTAPVATNYALTQSGTAQSAQGSTTSGTYTRNLTTALGTGSTVWFSFLLQPTTNGRVAVDLGSTVGTERMLAVGTTLRAILAAGGSDHSSSSVYTVGQSALMLGKIEIDAGGVDSLHGGNYDLVSLWANPDLTNLPVTPNLYITDTNFASLATGLTKLAIESYSTDASVPPIDLVTVSDGASAYQDVTGVVPEPSILAMLLGLGGLCLAFGLRRMRRR